MTVKLYLEGHLSLDARSIKLPLSSCVLLLITSYSHSSSFHVEFVRTHIKKGYEDDTENLLYVSIPTSGITNLRHTFTDVGSLPDLVRNVSLPCSVDMAARMVRSGLCIIVRHVVKVAHAAVPDQSLADLLGFREGSLRMCAEVSGWTKLCEVELPYSIAVISHHIKQILSNSCDSHQVIELDLPSDLLKLEAHLEKPPIVHNDDRRRREEIFTLHADLADPVSGAKVLERAKVEDGTVFLDRVTEMPHGWKKVRVQKKLLKMNGSSVCENCDTQTKVVLNRGGDQTVAGVSPERLSETLMSATYRDVQLIHLYSEGVEMTIADLCLFSYFYFLLESLNFNLFGLSRHIPRVIGWLHHMIMLPRLAKAAEQCGLNFEKLKEGLDTARVEDERGNIEFSKPLVQELSEDDLELSRRCRSKHKAIKPEVIEALNKLKNLGIEPVVGNHPRGTAVGLDWNVLPAYIHPKDGEVPLKRVERKCQQLENLVTAVMEVARPGDVIVDFCSGGGHLGIAIAHMLPQCKVYLVENKEESLARAQSRMAEMSSDNIILYQCNMDYFVGKFEVGVCLHACGSATDMVLQQCLRNDAAFVICPCCYGSIQRTHLLTYPRSRLYQEKNITYSEFLTLGHAADQTEFNISLEQQGRLCMNLVDFDRAQLGKEAGYDVTLTSLQPLTCSPKNNLLIGQKMAFIPITS